jgi:hypothetical protein
MKHFVVVADWEADYPVALHHNLVHPAADVVQILLHLILLKKPLTGIEMEN